MGMSGRNALPASIGPEQRGLTPFNCRHRDVDQPSHRDECIPSKSGR
jgi:hypothetical protein